MPQCSFSMKIRYRFPVKGHLRLSEPFSLLSEGREFAFELDAKKTVTHVSVVVPVSSTDLPVLTQDPKPGVKLHVAMQSPDLAGVLSIVRTLEGFLSTFAVITVDAFQVELTWLPESPQEKDSLQLLSFSTAKQMLAPEQFTIHPSALAGQAVLKIKELQKYEFALSFFRSGRQALEEQRYIDAYYSFYLILESLFAKGHFKNAKVKIEFRNCSVLQKAITNALANVSAVLVKHQGPYAYGTFEQRYKGKTSFQISDRFVDLRGFLHHHNQKHPEAWHPSKQDEYQFDSGFIAQACLGVLSELTYGSVLNAETAALFEKSASTKQASSASTP